MEKKNLNTGQSDFKSFIEFNCYYVDKSLFVEDVLKQSPVQLYTRPRRFGKTLNLSMLYYFFRNDGDYSYLFEGLKVKENPELWLHQGKYPTVFITFKDLKSSKYEDIYNGIKKIIFALYSNLVQKVSRKKLSAYHRDSIDLIIKKQATNRDYQESLKVLTEILAEQNNEKVIVLIDEYDVAIQEGFLHGFYDEIVEFMRVFIGSALKDNPNLRLGILTGVTRIAKEGLFSGFNNPKINTILQTPAADKFGITEEELHELLKYYEMEDHYETIKEWYNGYNFRGQVVYNPWSVINYLEAKIKGVHWANTADNCLLKDILRDSPITVKKELEILLQGGRIQKVIDEHIELRNVKQVPDNIYSFLLMSGYLTYRDVKFNGNAICELELPNKEVKYIIEHYIIPFWFTEITDKEKYEDVINNIIEGDIEIFTREFPKIVEESISYFDVSGEEPERFYHGFVLGMLVGLKDKAEIKSNRESGYGRYDVMVIPKDVNKRGVIFEFKKIDSLKEKSIEEAINNAKQQIKEKDYESELRHRGIKDISRIAVVFEGKRVHIEIF